MKIFFKNYSYNIVKNLVNQFAISIFGAFLSMATTAAENVTLSIVVSIFAICFYLFLLYTTTWEIGAKDRVKVEVGKKTHNPYTGLFIALVSNIPNFFIAISYFVVKVIIPVNPATNTINALLGLSSMIFEGMYTGLLMNVPVSTETMMIATWWPYFLIIIPALVTSFIAYNTGYKNFRLIAPLFDKKK